MAGRQIWPHWTLFRGHAGAANGALSAANDPPVGTHSGADRGHLLLAFRAADASLLLGWLTHPVAP